MVRVTMVAAAALLLCGTTYVQACPGAAKTATVVTVPDMSTAIDLSSAKKKKKPARAAKRRAAGGGGESSGGSPPGRDKPIGY